MRLRPLGPGDQLDSMRLNHPQTSFMRRTQTHEHARPATDVICPSRGGRVYAPRFSREDGMLELRRTVITGASSLNPAGVGREEVGSLSTGAGCPSTARRVVGITVDVDLRAIELTHDAVLAQEGTG